MKEPIIPLSKSFFLAAESEGPLDGELLHRYARFQDQGAFELLVWRYSEFVMRVCHARLRDRQLVEDAAQAVFLVLSKSASSFAPTATLAGWLHKVATRVAIDASKRRLSSHRRESVKRGFATPTEQMPYDEQLVIHDEVGRLPERYRIPIVLAYFDGLTRQEIARRTGEPKGTVDSLISRALQKLNKRLTRRGITLSVGLAAVTAASGSRSKLKFVEAVVRSAKAFPQLGNEGFPTIARELAKGALRTMYFKKLQWMMAVVTFCGMLTFSGIVALGAGSEKPLEQTLETTVTCVAPALKPEITENEILTYESRGARYGGFVPDPMKIHDVVFQPGREAAKKGLPGFCWYRLASEDALADLPQLQKNFGIEIRYEILSEKFSKLSVKHLARLKNLTSLTLEPGVLLVDLNELKALKNLTSLRILRAGAVDTYAKQVAELKSLTSLTLDGDVSDAGMKELAALKNLTSLSLEAYKLTGSGMKGLAELKSLTSLTLGGDMSDAGMKELAALKNLTSLSLVSDMVTDSGMKELAALKKLTSLRIIRRKNIVTAAAMKEVAALKNLTTLELDGTLTEVGMKEVAKLENLTSLALSIEEPLTEVGMKEVAKLKNLTSLTLYAMQMTDAAVKEIAKLKNLTSLTICTDKQLTEVGMKEVAKLENLTSLTLYAMQMTDAAVKEVAKLKNLTSLTLCAQQLTDAGFKELKTLNNLTNLVISGTFTDAPLHELAALSNLTSLSVGSNQLTDVGVEELTALKNLSSLQLFSNKLTDAGLKHLTSLTNLTLLRLKSSNVTLEGLKNLEKLKNLDLLYLDSPLPNQQKDQLKKVIPRCHVQ